MWVGQKQAVKILHNLLLPKIRDEERESKVRRDEIERILRQERESTERWIHTQESSKGRVGIRGKTRLQKLNSGFIERIHVIWQGGKS